MSAQENGGFDPKTLSPAKLLLRRIVASALTFLTGMILSRFITPYHSFQIPPPSLSGWLALIGQCIFCVYCAYQWGWRNEKFISKAYTGSGRADRGKATQKKIDLRVLANMLLASNLFEKRMPSAVDKRRILTAIIGIGFRLAAKYR